MPKKNLIKQFIDSIDKSDKPIAYSGKVEKGLILRVTMGELLKMLLLTATGLVLFLLFTTSSLIAQNTEEDVTIVYAKKATYEERLAAKEIQRYIYLRTSKVIPIQITNQLPKNGNIIVVAHQEVKLVKKWIEKVLEQEGIDRLRDQEYILKTLTEGERKILLVTGGDRAGILYGAYRLAENLGIKFYLDQDLVPETQVKWKMPQLDEVKSPLFKLRGILPFHDFPEGPDWWDLDSYKAVISQLPKLRMNFIGFHTYPERPDRTYDEDSVKIGWDAEPTVWIGDPKDVNRDGSVNFGYPASYANTMRDGDWGYYKKPTSDYAFGASMLFEKDAYGSDVMEDYLPHPTTQQGFKTVFKNTGHLLNNAFTWAHQLGVKTTVGTETPLTIPRLVKQRFKEQGHNPDDSTTIRRAYEGMFKWIKKNYPLDYYWFWTPEDWTWEGTKKGDVEHTLRDLRQAMKAAENQNVPFKLATSGWVLGPPYDRTLFDSFLPRQMPIGAINRQVGFTPNDTSFADVQGRPTWIIPWLEDDPAMTQPQLWVGRIRRDAAQALAYKATGLIGIHWRTRSINPMISALAQAGWDQTGWNPDFPGDHNINSSRDKIVADSLHEKQYQILPTKDFYEEWAVSQFGEFGSKNIADIFSDMDSFGPMTYEELSESIRPSHLPRPTEWIRGPGGIQSDTSNWVEVKEQYAFVDRMEELRPIIKGQANQARFDYWLNSFNYLKAIGKLSTILGRFEKAMVKAKASNNRKEQIRMAKEQILPIRIEMIAQLHEVYNYLLSTVSTTGDMGTVDNLERHIMPILLEEPGKELEFLLGEKLPAEAMPSKEYTGSPQLIVPVVRSNLAKGERLRIKVIVLSKIKPEEVALFWRPLGNKKYNMVNAHHINRGVYSFTLPEEVTKESFEYYIQARINQKEPLLFPVTAPKLNQSVITVSTK